MKRQFSRPESHVRKFIHVPAVAIAAVALLATSAVAQTAGYLYYAGGSIANGADQPEDGTLTSDNGVFSVLVADVAVTPESVTISNWRFANTNSNRIPADNPNTAAQEAFSWMYVEDSVFVHDGRLYVGPGDWNADGTRSTGNCVAYIDIDPDTGALGSSWNFSPVFPSGPDVQAIGGGEFVDMGGGNAYYYVAGGHDGNNGRTSRILVSKLQAGGGLGAWTTVTALPAADWFNRASSVDGSLVVVDGFAVAGTASHYAPITAGTGALGAFTSIGTWAAANRWANVVEHLTSPGGTDCLVIAGGNGQTTETFVSIVTAGVPGAWTAGTALPVGKRQMASVAIEDMISAWAASTPPRARAARPSCKWAASTMRACSRGRTRDPRDRSRRFRAWSRSAERPSSRNRLRLRRDPTC